MPEQALEVQSATEVLHGNTVVDMAESTQFRGALRGRLNLQETELRRLCGHLEELMRRYDMTTASISKALGYPLPKFKELCEKFPMLSQAIARGKKQHEEQVVQGYIDQTLYLMGQHGFQQVELCKAIGIGLEKWKSLSVAYPALATAFQEGMDKFDSGKVERALLKRALGFTYEEKTVTEEEALIAELPAPKSPDPNKPWQCGGGSTKAALRQKMKEQLLGQIKMPGVKRKTTVKEVYVIPDVTAMQTWLHTRDKERWPNTKHVQVEGRLDSYHVHDVRVIEYDKNDLESIRRAYAHSFGEAAALALLPAPAGNGTGHLQEGPGVLDMERPELCVDV
jgi:hypothetical protein